MTVPEAADQLRVDYYAGMIAIFAVILVAKFVTHRGNSATKLSLRLHGVAVASAGLGAAICLGMLGWAKPDETEQLVRIIVVLPALVAGWILIVDVMRDPDKTGNSPNDRVGATETPPPDDV
jgi:hypothetical protein